MRIYLILVLVFGVAFSSCTTDEYDLSKGNVNYDMTIGGDSLTIPIGKTERILLGSLLNGQSLDILKKSENGDYSFSIKDSTQVKIDSIPRVSFAISPISISPITSSFGDNTKIPPFSIDPINITSSLSSLPTIDLNGFGIDPINMPYTKSMTFTAPSGVKRQSSAGVSRLKSSDDPVYGPFSFTAENTITESLSYDFPTELNSINTVKLKSGEVTLTFDKSEITKLGVFSQQSDTIKSFKIEFPAEFRLSLPTPHIPEISIDPSGSTIVITGAALSGGNGDGIFRTTFTIERLENMNNYKFSNLDGTSKINYVKPIKYSIDYVLWGSASDLSFVGKSANIDINLVSTPKIDDLNISTTDISVSDPTVTSKPLNGDFNINQQISIPSDISKVNSITFADGANLQLSFADINSIINPLSFITNITDSCEIDLPKKFILKPGNGINVTKNTFKLPYDQLFGHTIQIDLSGMNVDQSVQNGSITLNDTLKYMMYGLKVGSSGIWVSAINGMKSKEISIQGTVSPLTVSDASVETKSISFAIPEQSPNIHIDQAVSDKIQKIYSITLKTPTTIEFSIAVSDLPAIGAVYFRNYTIQFPSFLKFKAGDVNNKNQLVLGDSTLLNNPDSIKITDGKGIFNKTLQIDGIDFGANGHALTNGNFNLDESVSMKGSAYIMGSNLKSKDLTTGITINPVVTIGNMTIGQIEGELASNIIPSTASEPQSIKLDLPSFMTDKSNVLDIVNPVMQLIIGNSMGIGLKLPLTITPYQNNSPISSGIISTNKIVIAPANPIGQTTWSNYWISNLGLGASTGFDTINVPLSNLFKSVPDRIDISATPSVTGTRSIIDLYSTKNQIDIKYSVNIPLSFGQNFTMQYVDTIGGLKDQLAQILKNTKQVEIIATVENSIPLELSFGATALNTEKGVINGVTLSASNKIKAGNADGTAQKTPIKIILSESKDYIGALQQLDALIMVISANSNSTVAGLPLKSDQYISVELRVKIPNGITINPSSNK